VKEASPDGTIKKGTCRTRNRCERVKKCAGATALTFGSIRRRGADQRRRDADRHSRFWSGRARVARQELHEDSFIGAARSSDCESQEASERLERTIRLVLNGRARNRANVAACWPWRRLRGKVKVEARP